MTAVVELHCSVMVSELGRNIGRVLLRMRDLAHVTQVQLADKSGVHKNTILKIEKGEQVNPNLATIEALAQSLGSNVVGVVAAASNLAEQQDRIDAYQSSAYRHAERITDSEIEWLRSVPLMSCLGPTPTDKAITMLILAKREASMPAA